MMGCLFFGLPVIALSLVLVAVLKHSDKSSRHNLLYTSFGIMLFWIFFCVICFRARNHQCKKLTLNNLRLLEDVTTNQSSFYQLQNSEGSTIEGLQGEGNISLIWDGCEDMLVPVKSGDN